MKTITRRLSPAQWDSWYRGGRAVDRKVTDAEADRFLRHVSLYAGSSVLDVGCDIGGFSRQLLRWGHDVLGLDVSPAAVEIAQRRGTQERLRYGVHDFGASTRAPHPKGNVPMYAFGLCIDQQYLLPGLATLAGLADSLTPAARRNAAVRVLTLDLTPAQALLLSNLAKRVGFGSFDVRRCAPMRTSRMADASYITVTTYLRFEFTPGFVRRPYLIYVDADVLVRGDLTEPLDLLAPDETGAVRDEFNPAVGACPALPGAAERWPHLRGHPYFNAGVLWTHTSHMPAVRKGVQHALTHARRHILHNDQDALNLWLLHSGRVRPVAAGFNRFETSRFLERGNWVRRVVTRPLRPDPSAALVHFVGPEKPWQADCPATEDVAEYRRHLSRTLRHVRRLGAIGAEPAGAW